VKKNKNKEGLTAFAQKAIQPFEQMVVGHFVYEGPDGPSFKKRKEKKRNKCESHMRLT
jgi:hypothetical protein